MKTRMLPASLLLAATLGVAVAAPVNAQAISSVPAGAVTVTDWYKQNVYTPQNDKIGDIKDVLVDKSGKIHGLVIAVGGFLGAGEKDVIVPFSDVKAAMKNDKWYLTMNASKDDLKKAKGFKYDSNKTTWVPDSK
ncbi:MAG: PRC-barrel domain-containing protein [Sphingomicrobium sp.]